MSEPQISSQLAHQRKNIAAGRCRYGWDHPRPKPGKTYCERCRKIKNARKRQEREESRT